MGQFTVKPTKTAPPSPGLPSPGQWTWRDGQLIILLATGSLLVMTGAIIAPVLPAMVQQLSLESATAGYLVSAHYLTVAMFSPLLGLLADRVGPRRVLIGSLLLYALFGIAGGLLSSFGAILITRVLLGAASGGIAAASLGLLVQRYRSESSRAQAIAAVATVLTLANIGYPLIAGLVGIWHWRCVFALYGVGFPLARLVAKRIGAPSANGHRKQPGAGDANGEQSLLTVVQTPGILRLYALQCGTAAIAHATIIYLPLYLKATLAAGTALNGGVLAMQAIGAAAVSACGVRPLTKRFGLGTVTALGFACMALSLVVLPQALLLVFLLPSVMVFGVGLGLVVPSLYTWVANLTPPQWQSSGLALCVGANFLGQFLSPAIFGKVLAMGELSTIFYAAAGGSLLLGLSLLGGWRSGISQA